ncbi:MAG TPA: HAD family acid phosphatase [Candidatus Limnocylindrales bacterium]|nr:HAD family acid phosphatase [Candidatus Limnocylindrales bacterium]
MRGFVSLRRSRLVALVAVAALTVGAAGIAVAAPDTLSFTPKHADQITNIDVLRQEIKNYYGTPTAKTGATSCDPNLAPAADSNYTAEAESVAAAGTRWLDARAGKSSKQAIVLDVDDTTLVTWNYELCSNWAFDPGTNGNFVNGELFPAVPGMVDMVNRAAQQGYAIFFLTGRPQSQEERTLGNLTPSDVIGLNAGYTAPTDPDGAGPEDGLYTKPAVGSYPAYLDQAEFCAAAIHASPAASCATIPYKSGVRAHIEDLGFDIVANFGDQFSDLEGGFADRTFKLPNPNYFLP